MIWMLIFIKNIKQSEKNPMQFQYRKISIRSPCSNKRPSPVFDAKNGDFLDVSSQNTSL